MTIPRTTRPWNLSRLERLEDYLVRRAEDYLRGDSLTQRVLDVVVNRLEVLIDMDDENDNPNAWLCNCGNWIEDGLHCDLCGAEPPWGCPGECCQGGEEYVPEDDESWMEDYP